MIGSAMELDNDRLRRKELNILVSQLSIDTMHKVKKFWIIDLMDIMDEG
ncbi:MAG: hypothetical protein WBP88_07440 [Nitrososphaeraceae archaeon]